MRLPSLMPVTAQVRPQQHRAWRRRGWRAARRLQIW